MIGEWIILGLATMVGDASPSGAGDWLIDLGRRVHATEQSIPVVDRVVLVPDGATYLDEIGRWSPRGHWPVLFLDDRLAPMFVRRFAPREVLLRESVGVLPSTAAEREALLRAEVVRAWGGEPRQDSISEIFALNTHEPPGLVITSTLDDAWPAAVALAAGRGQLLAFLDGFFGQPDDLIDAERFEVLQHAIRGRLDSCGYAYANPEDTIDAITIARRMAGRVRLGVAERESDGFAVTDVIGRHGTARRFATTGWIFGREHVTAYMAMCSLFLPRERVWFANAIPSDEGVWTRSAIAEAIGILDAEGYIVHELPPGPIDIAIWRGELPGGLDADAVILHTDGVFDRFTITEMRLHSGDLPTLNTPAVVHLTHSWALRTPTSSSTIGGHWLRAGAYAVVGAMHDPLLSGFQPPTLLAERFALGVPFLDAARVAESPGPWKLNTIGDPLLLIAPPGRGVRSRRTDFRDDPSARAIDVRARAAALLRKTATGERHALIEAVRMINLLGEDAIVADLWRLAVEREVGGDVASGCLGALFRKKQLTDFVTAWSLIDVPDEYQRDMLWHALGQRVETPSRPLVELLVGALRPGVTHHELRRLRPHIIALLGRSSFEKIVKREIAAAIDGVQRTNLLELLE